MVTAFTKHQKIMQRTDFYAMHKIIHRAAIRELKQVVKNFGGQAYFGTADEWNDCDEERTAALNSEYATHTERPLIAANIKHSDGPWDYFIDSVMIDADDRLVILAEAKDSVCDPFELMPDEIEFGHVSFITDCIPDRDLS